MENKELNSILRSTGQQSETGRQVKEYTENVLFHVLNRHSDQKATRFQPYGSAAEDLKCVQPSDIGDVDVVIFPVSENLMVHEDMIEYSENPMHVRIKGTDHPVLQSCLLEGTEYVATSALKNFHPGIFGSSVSQFPTFLGHTTQLMSRKETSSFGRSHYHVKNNITSPALTVNFEKAFDDTLSECFQSLKDPQDVANFDSTSLESMVLRMCTARELDFARAYSEVANELTDLANYSETVWNEYGTNIVPGIFTEFFQKSFWYGGLKGRIIENGSLSQPREEGAMERHCSDDEAMHGQCNAAQGSESEKAQHSQQTSINENASTPQKSDKFRRRTDDVETVTSKLAAVTPADNWSQFEVKNILGARAGVEITNSSDTKQGGQAAQKEDPNNLLARGKKQVLRREELIYKKHPPGNATGNQEHEEERAILEECTVAPCSSVRNPVGRITEAIEDSLQERQLIDTSEVQNLKVEGGVDYVPALKSPGWPKVAQEWTTRERKWPSQDVVDKIVQEGFHLVVKPSKTSVNKDCDFRLSFGHAEYLLIQEMNNVQRECYRCLKKYHRAYLQTTQKGLVSFHLKNLFLQIIEETGTEMWTDENRAECMKKVLANLLKALEKKDLRHFFVGSYNLFCVDYIRKPEILESVADTVEQLLENPIQMAKKLIQATPNENPRHVVKQQRVPANKQTPSIQPETTTASEEPCGKVKKPPFTAGTTQREQRKESPQGNGPSKVYRLHELREEYLAISKELTDKAFNEDESNGLIESLDPQEKTLVYDLREMRKIHKVHIDTMYKMFDNAWLVVFCKVWFSNEPIKRRRVLLGIKGVIELYKYLLRQDDFAPGNEQALISRLLNPDAEDPFDVSHLMPVKPGEQFFSRLCFKIESHQAKSDANDIPLD